MSPFNILSKEKNTPTMDCTPTYIPMNDENLRKFKQIVKPKTKLLALDIDDTVYPNSFNIEEQLKKRTLEYIASKHSIQDIEGAFLNYQYKYGTGTKGFIRDYSDFTQDVFVKSVLSKIDYDILKPDLELKHMLGEFKGNLIAFTNAPKEHAENVLKKLGYEELFEYILHVDMTDPNYICKPDYKSYCFVEELFSIKPENIFFVDDRMVNVAIAQDRKWNAIMVSCACDIKSILKSIQENETWLGTKGRE